MKRLVYHIPGFGTGRALAAKSALCCALALSASLSGCTKEHRDTPGDDTRVEIAFATGGLQIDPAVEGDPSVMPTRADNEALIAVDTAFRLIVYPKDAAVSGTPTAQNSYKISDNTGKVAPAAVTATGSVDATGTPPGELMLLRDNYDFYYFSPALPVTAGKISGLTNDKDYMTVKQAALEVKPGADGKCHITSVQFARLCSRLDVNISAKANAFVSSLVVDEAGAEISGLAESAEFTLGHAALSSVNGTNGKVLLQKTGFETSGTGANTVLSTEGKAGAIVLPLSNRNVVVSIALLINSFPVHSQVTLSAATFKAGFKYLLDLKVDRTGAPSFTLTSSPWTEGGSSDSEMTSQIKIGEMRDGGIIFWIDPDDTEHYKVVSLEEAPAKTWSGAFAWAGDHGKRWYLPVQEELTEIYNARKNNGGADNIANSAIDVGLAANLGTPLGSGGYWSATEVTSAGADAQSVTLATGVASASAKASQLATRAVKEVCHNLSANGTANCYIVTKAHTRYMFDATQRGNGKASLEINDPDVWLGQRPNINPNDDLISPRLLAPASALTVWASGTSIDGVIKEVTLQGGYVYFTTSGSSSVSAIEHGNTLLGVKDADGNLIWSWHIWATDYDPATEDVVYTTRALVGDGLTTPGHIIATPSSSVTMMGRNLGSVNNTPKSPGSIGLQYQWGRKDPFPAAATTSSSDETTPFTSTYATKNASGYDWAVTPGSDSKVTAVGAGADGSIAYAILYPTHFITFGANRASGDWLNVNTVADQRDYLWGDPNPTNTHPNTLGGAKSIYDPCPPGYRVPKQDSWTSFSTNNTSVNGAYVNATTATFDPGSGYSFYCNTANSTSSYYPAGGLRNDNTGCLTKTGVNGYYWSSAPYYGSYANAAFLYFGSGYVSPLNNNYKSYGCSVRCAKE